MPSRLLRLSCGAAPLPCEGRSPCGQAFVAIRCLPDLRRWTRFDEGHGPFEGGSYFPTGTHPNAQWGPYGEWTCFPIPIGEYEGNPNLQRPANPNVPPGI